MNAGDKYAEMVGMDPAQRKQIHDLTTKAWLNPAKARLNMLRGVHFEATKDNNLLAAIAISNDSDDPRLARARDAFITMAMLVEGEKYSAKRKLFESEKRVLFVERETAGEYWNAVISKRGPRAKSWLKEFLGIGPAHNR